MVTDFSAYPSLFPEIKGTRVLRAGGRRRRQGGDARRVPRPGRAAGALRARPRLRSRRAHTVDWTFVEGEIVTNSVGSWRFSAEGEATAIDYRVSLDVKAPVPGFVLRKVTDGLVAASIPSMFSAIEREVRKRQSSQPLPT